MLRIALVVLQPFDQLRVVCSVTNASAGHEHHIGSRVVFKRVVGNEPLTVHSINRICLLRNGKNFVACPAEHFPWPGKVNNFHMIEQKNRNGRRIVRLLFIDERHATLWTGAALIKGELVARLATRRTHVNLSSYDLTLTLAENRRTTLQHRQTTHCENCACTACYELSPCYTAFSYVRFFFHSFTFHNFNFSNRTLV